MSPDPLGVDASFDELTVPVDDGVTLRVLRWRPPQRTKPPVVFVAGWVSDISGWLEVLRTLVADRELVYLETREKPSARLDRRLRAADFTVARLAVDLTVVCEQLGVEPKPVLAGSSLGGTVILEALKHGRTPASAAFLIGPNARFRIPWWGWPLLFLPDVCYAAGREVALAYLRRYRVDATREPEQVARYERTVRLAEPHRLKLSGRAFGRYTVWPDLASVRLPVGVAFAASDTLHSEAEVRRIVAALPRGVAVPCPSNLHMHRAAVVADLDRFVAGIASSHPPTR